MKFLCLICDAQMRSVENKRQRDEGTMAIVLECPECFGQVGMLTNPMETKLLDSLDVSVCPVGGKGRDRAAGEAAAATVAAESRCPVSGASTTAGGEQPSMPWNEEAERRLGNVPGFARPMVRASIEAFAQGRGETVVTPAVMEAARASMGM